MQYGSVYLLNPLFFQRVTRAWQESRIPLQEVMRFGGMFFKLKVIKSIKILETALVVAILSGRRLRDDQLCMLCVKFLLINIYDEYMQKKLKFNQANSQVTA